MRNSIGGKLKESLAAVLPIALIVLVLSLTVVPLPAHLIIGFLISTVFLIVGMSLFTVGVDIAMLPIGHNVGAALSKSKKLWLMLGCTFILGFIITIAGMDLMVLAKQLVGFNTLAFIIGVSVGAGLSLMLSILKIVFNFSLSVILAICFSIIFILMFFVPDVYLPLSFDAGSVTTGPVSVPFLIAYGLGLSATRSKNKQEDSFGMISLCAVGPVIVIMVMSLFADLPDGTSLSKTYEISQNLPGILSDLSKSFGQNLYEILLVLAPIVIIFFIFQFSMIQMTKKKIVQIIIGLLYTYFGVVIFLTGVTVGYFQVGSLLGKGLAGLSFNWILFPLSLLIGFFIVAAEPAVHVLSKQVEEVTEGIIHRRTMLVGLSIGVAGSLLMSMIRVMYNINFMWFITPIYLLALILAFINNKMFTSIAFDSGITSGSMAVCFLVPFINGISETVGNNVLLSAFGTVGLIAAVPILVIQIIGFIFKIKVSSRRAREFKTRGRTRIIEFVYEE